MYTIGQMSKLSHVSARMLRHYDAIGLLRPALVDAVTGYRWYDAAQLAVISRIRQLQGYGFPLAAVAELLTLAPDELAEALTAREQALAAEIDRLQDSRDQIRAEIARWEERTMSREADKVITMNVPAQQVFGLRRTIAVTEIHGLFAELAEAAAKRGLRRTGLKQLVYVGSDFDPRQMVVEAQMEVAGEDEQVCTVPVRHSARRSITRGHMKPSQQATASSAAGWPSIRNMRPAAPSGNAS